MEDELQPYIDQYNIVVNRCYIDNEPELEQLFGSRVPVLMLGDKTICEYFLDPAPLLQALGV